jgi:hypothetical protein
MEPGIRQLSEGIMIRIPLLATFLFAAMLSPSHSEGPVKSAVQGTVQGTKEIGQGVAQGTAQAGKGVAQGTVGVAKGTATVAKKTGKGVWCIVTLGYGC